MRETYDAWAELYDTVYADVRDDVPFYVDLARRSGGPVLELGCGTGRITVPIAVSGVAITGLDISPAMLQLAKEKAFALASDVDAGSISLVESDMREFDLGKQFEIVIAPYRSLQSLLTVPEQISMLAAVKTHLEPGGMMAFDVFMPEPSTLVQDQDVAYHLKDLTDPETGVRRVLYQQSAYDNLAQVVHARIIIEELDDSGAVAKKLYREFSLRYSYRWEIYHLLASCGFEDIQVYGGFDRSELDETSEDMVWTARLR